MKGTCQKCGCTADRACVIEPGEACWWVDGQQDLCSACAARLMADDYPLEPETTIAELVLVVRSLRCGLEAARIMFAQHQQAILQAADNLSARCAEDGERLVRLEPDFDHLEERRIWTP